MNIATKSKTLVVAQVESDEHILREITKQTFQLTETFIYVDKSPARGIDNRRKRIANNHQIIYDYVKKSDADFIIQVEGDSVLDERTFEKLFDDLIELNSSKLGYVSGIQVGRHGLYCLGAWNIYEDTFESLDYKSLGFQVVDATGFYCLLAKRDTWLKGHCFWDAQGWGPDVNWGLSLTQQGYEIYVDMDLTIGHKIKRGVIWPRHASTCNAKFYKNQQGRWLYKTSV